MATHVVDIQASSKRTRRWSSPWAWFLRAAALVVVVAGTIALEVPWLADRQHQTSVQVAQDQRYEGELQNYLDRMSDLLLTQRLATSKQGDIVRQVARARTLTVLTNVDVNRKGLILRFLYETGLIDGATGAVIDLSGANLSGVDLNALRSIPSNNPHSPNLSGANLSGANLSGASLIGANLSSAYMEEADLQGADLSGADLVGSHLYGANLSGAHLSGADLGGTHLTRVDLSGADLTGARLKGADLTESHLNGANLAAADLTGTSLAGATLKGTRMPDGSTHP